MRRNHLYICLALLTFTIGFLLSGTSEGLTAALIVAFIVFVSLQKLTKLNLNLHHLKVTFLTLIIWIPIAGVILNALPKAGSCVIDLPQPEINQDYIQPSISFTYMGVISVRTIDRGCIGMEEYEANDGVKIYTSTDEYESPALAFKEFQRMLRDNTKVIERSPVLDKLGQQIGERVIAIRSFDGDDRVYSFILRRVGTNIHYTGSPLLSRALEFERVYQ